jgi:DNA-binding PadR family transcriptional regulator
MSVREGLLALLAAGPKHGYQLRQEFEMATAGVWPLNVGQVYTTLDRLERDGLVAPTADTNTERRSFQITDSGRTELEDWFSAGPHEQPHRETTVIKVLVALYTEGVDARQVIDVQRAALTDQLQQHRRAQRKALAAAGDDSGVAELGAAMLFDALVTRVESDLRWLDLCDQRLTSFPAATSDRKAQS